VLSTPAGGNQAQEYDPLGIRSMRLHGTG